MTTGGSEPSVVHAPDPSRPLYAAGSLSSSRGSNMLEGPAVAKALKEAGVTHFVWIPDSDLGTWEPAILATPGLKLVRVCREGEAIALAGGLLLGGQRPLIVIQCTGLFEAGDALRNLVHDMKLPLFFIIGIRSYLAHQKKATADTCPVFTEPIMKAWQVPYTILDATKSAADLAAAYRQAWAEKRSGAVLIPE
jgi:sulfopyruvate decarboxylase TPP-binding subunit